jgi:hypothetical protein
MAGGLQNYLEYSTRLAGLLISGSQVRALVRPPSKIRHLCAFLPYRRHPKKRPCTHLCTHYGRADMRFTKAETDFRFPVHVASRITSKTNHAQGHCAFSPDDVLRKLMERDRLAAADTRTEAERHLGDPPPGRSALAQRTRAAGS